MNHTPTVLAVCCTLIACSALLSRAGNLTPPPGPIEPTMATLEQLDVKLNGLLAAQAELSPPWEVRVVVAPDPNVLTQLVSGSGMVHQVIVHAPSGSYSLFDLEDGGGTPLLSGQYDGTGTTMAVVALDVRYEIGLLASGTKPNMVYNVFYRPDPPPPATE